MKASPSTTIISTSMPEMFIFMCERGLAASLLSKLPDVVIVIGAPSMLVDISISMV
jgi:hypothetical protein